MKKILITLISLISLNCVQSQSWDLVGNNGTDVSNDFVGTDDDNALAIRTEDFIRILIREGGTGDTDGFIAMAANLTSNYTPLERLHLDEDGVGRVYLRFTQDGDTNSVGGLNVGLSANGNGGFADFRMFNQEAIRIWQNNTRKMIIEQQNAFPEQSTGTNIQDVTRISIITDDTPLAQPGSTLHLNGVGLPSTDVERTWMHIGTTYTDNEDYMYVGIQQRPNEEYETGGSAVNDAVIAWGKDVTGLQGPDNLRFVFLEELADPSTNQANSFQGQEVGRFSPDGNFGIGNFNNNGLDEQPTHRLDVDGQVRIRDVVGLTTPAGATDVLLVGNQEDAAGDYEVQRIAFNADAGDYLGGDGQWHDVATTTDCDYLDIGGNKLITAAQYSGSGLCPDDKYRVHIGEDFGAKAKLWVKNKEDSTLVPAGIKITNLANGVGNMGGLDIYAQSLSNTTGQNYGAYVWASAAEENWGGYFHALADANTVCNIGLDGYGRSDEASCATNDNWGVYGHANGGDVVVGIYGAVTGDGCSSTAVAGYFNGDVEYTGTLTDVSDQMLKTNVNDIENALNSILSLQPKSYEFLDDNYPGMNLPDGTNYGLIAQDVQQVIPELVKESKSPGTYENGDLVYESVEYLSLNYTGLIPFLIQGMKEQQQMIDDQQDLIEQILLDLETCCSLSNPKNQEIEESEQLKSDGFELFQNVPNPFKEETRIDYTITESGRAKLIIQNEAGQLIKVAFEGMESEGRYQYNWNTTGLPSGIYYYSLFLDDVMQLKKAVKL